MHLVFCASGIKHDLDLFEIFMQTRTFNMPFIDHNEKRAKEKNKNMLLQSQLRPINFYDFIFPKGELDMVLNSLQIGTDPDIVSANASLPKAVITMLQKALKLKKIPNPDISKGAFPLYKNNVRLVGIGIRDDKDLKFPNGWEHEGI